MFVVFCKLSEINVNILGIWQLMHRFKLSTLKSGGDRVCLLYLRLVFSAKRNVPGEVDCAIPYYIYSFQITKREETMKQPGKSETGETLKLVI